MKTCMSLCAVILTLFSCGGGGDTRTGTQPALSTLIDAVSAHQSAALPIIGSISPSSAAAGSSDLRATIAGSNFIDQGNSWRTVVVWSSDPNNPMNWTLLSPTVVSSTQLSVVIPAKLLQDSGQARLFVVNGNEQQMAQDGPFSSSPASSSVVFIVEGPES